MKFQAVQGGRDGFAPRGASLDLWKYRGSEVIVSGPAECLSADSVVNGRTVEDLFESGQKHFVQTQYGEREANPPFAKGKADLFRVHLSSGESFSASAGHFILTLRGWLPVALLRRGELLPKSASSRLPSISESCPLVSPQDDRDCLTVQRIERIGHGWYFDFEVPFYGHYEAAGVIHHNTGKTYSCCQKLNALLWKYPRSQAVLVRKVRDTIHSTALQTFKKVIGQDSPVQIYGGEKAEWLSYPNGSRLWIAGMDNPGKALSSERDFVYVNQAEELNLTDWETLLTRATGRAGNAPYPQVMGDCNPESPYHWIKQRSALKVFESRHEDNPTLWNDSKQEWTEQGQRTLAILDSLTGVRKERLRYGRWVSAEGTVYEFDRRRHLIDQFCIPPSWTKFRAFDFGFTNPFVCLWFAIDTDGRLILYRELYMSQRTVRVHAEKINERSHGENYAVNVADHDAEGRATLEEAGIYTTPAEKSIEVGIAAVQERLKLAGDGKPRLLVMRGALIEQDETLANARKPVCTEQEFDVYQWAKAADGRPIKEVPLDVNNHGLDALRYAVQWADKFGKMEPGDCGVHTSEQGSILDDLGDIWR